MKQEKKDLILSTISMNLAILLLNKTFFSLQPNKIHQVVVNHMMRHFFFLSCPFAHIVEKYEIFHHIREIHICSKALVCLTSYVMLINVSKTLIKGAKKESFKFENVIFKLLMS